TVLPPTKKAPDYQAEWNRHRLGLALSLDAFWAPGRFTVENGLELGLDASYRIPIATRARVQFGLGIRGVKAGDSTHIGARLPIGLAIGIGRFAESVLGVTAGYTRVLFDRCRCDDISMFSGSFEIALAFLIHPNVSVGFSPLVMSVFGSSDVHTLFALEP